MRDRLTRIFFALSALFFASVTADSSRAQQPKAGGDSALFALDLNGNGKTDRIVKQYRRGRFEHVRESRIAIFLDSPSLKPAWASAWDDGLEMDVTVERPRLIVPGSTLVEIDASGGDYDEGRFLVVHDKVVTDEILFGVDYGRGMLTVDTTGASLTIVATDDHLSLRGRAVSSRKQCPDNQQSALRLVFDRRRHGFIPERGICLTLPNP